MSDTRHAKFEPVHAPAHLHGNAARIEVQAMPRCLPADAAAMFDEYGDPAGPGGIDALHDAARINRPINYGQEWYLREAAKAHEVAPRSAGG